MNTTATDQIRAHMIRKAERRAVADMTRLTSHAQVNGGRLNAFEAVAFHARSYGGDGAASIARHAASAARARDVELDDLLLARMLAS